MRRWHVLGFAGLLGGLAFAGCVARGDNPLTPVTDDDAGPPDAIDLGGGETPDASPDALDLAPHAVRGVDPPHGPFVGGTRVTLRGAGFASDTRVWFGAVEVPARDVIPIDPERLQVVTPAGAAGEARVRVQNGSDRQTRAELAGGFTYDRFYADPASGPTSGGTIITLHGQETGWNERTEVSIDREPCALETLVSETELRCTTPQGEAGSKVLSVVTEDGEREDLLDGYVYGNSDSGFKGGFAGPPLDDELTVVAFDTLSGDAIPGAKVLVGDSAEAGQVGETDESGVVAFTGALGPKRKVTLVKKCFQPVTFFDVPVDHVTAYLAPVLSPDCGAGGELPPSGGVPGLGAGVSGEVVWPLDGELRRRGWSNVPTPAGPSEQQVAYVFRLSSDPTDDFRLPSALSSVTRAEEGSVGYKFYQSTSPGNFALYALAGIEDRSKDPPVFTAYAMGLQRGVAVTPGKTSSEVFIEIDTPLDHALTVELEPPRPGPRGPDRLRATVAIQLEGQGFALLPQGAQTRSLPGASTFSFVGVPPLVGSLAGSRYYMSASAVTGQSGSPPLSVIGAFTATTTSEPLDLGGFVPLPVVTSPPKGKSWDLRGLELEAPVGGQAVDLTIVEIEAGGGLYAYTIVAPGARATLELPDLTSLDPEGGLPRGALTVRSTFAHIDDFVYGTLRYRQLDARGWNAYALDTIFSAY